MKRTLLISLAAASILTAEEIKLDTLTVESTSLSDVNTEEIKSADLAEALATKVPSITLVRRSGIANDIILRGQKRDNINVIVDGGKIYGACPNRMDPPTSHVITTNIDSIKIVEGPYDVEHAGTLSGMVEVETTRPKKGLHGNFNVGTGSFGYKKLSGTVTGGNDDIRMLVGASGEWSGQYKDGDGNTFAGQIDQAIADGKALPGAAYRDSDRGKAAYSKKSLMAKMFVNFTDRQELQLGFTANRSDDVLYPNSKMDASYDNSDLYNVKYIARDLGEWSKKLTAEFYYSFVDHPMWTRWRKMSDPAFAPNNGKKKVMTNHLTATTEGATLKNMTELGNNLELTVGLDGYLRNWDGAYDMNNKMDMGKSIDDANTRNIGLFAELEKRTSKYAVKLGVRYDNTRITSGNDNLQDNDYESVGANVFGDYKVSDTLGFFGGLGTASRVPDARELYFQSKVMNGNVMVYGTPDLDQTTNYEVDAGMTNTYDNFNMKTRLFYSALKNYIYFNSGKKMHNFENIDATIYGFSVSGTWFMTDSVYMDFGAAWQRGEKDKALEGQTNTNLADIPPLKGNVAFNWNYLGDSLATAEVVAADKWSEIDDDNGEQEIDAWAVVNLKVDHRFSRHLGITVGVDNLFDETYAVSNTYKDLILIIADPTGDVMLMNEPGRYFYANVNLQF